MADEVLETNDEGKAASPPSRRIGAAAAWGGLLLLTVPFLYLAGEAVYCVPDAEVWAGPLATVATLALVAGLVLVCTALVRGPSRVFASFLLLPALLDVLLVRVLMNTACAM